MKSLKMLMMAAFTILSLSAFAQNTGKHKMKNTGTKTDSIKLYSCPMHPEVTSAKVGKCSQCGMDLVKSKKEKIKMYTCLMHADVTSEKAGKCPQCGMTLKEKE